MTQELNLPVGSQITLLPKGAHGEELTIRAVPAETQPPQGLIDAVIKIERINKHGTVEWSLDGGALNFAKEGDTIRIPRYIYPSRA
jgi:hypothetical protein